MKILLITRNFPPLTGGMEKLFYHIYRQLSKDHQIAMVGPEGAESFVEQNTTIYTTLPLPVSRFLLSSQILAFKAAFKFKPDIIISASGLTAFAAYITGKLCRTPVITLVHGLDIIVDNYIYQQFFLPAIRACDAVIANSKNTARLANEKGIDLNKITVINPGVEIKVLAESQPNKDYILNGINLLQRRVLLSVGRLSPRKGLLEFIEFSLPLIRQEIPDVLLVIVGEDAHTAIGKHFIKHKIKQLLADKNLQDNVLMLGYQNDTQINEIYRYTDIFVFPIIEMPGDIEGFGMVALEAAERGVPTVAFAAGGVPDAVQEGKSGFIVTPGDYPQLANKIIRWLKNNKSQVTQHLCRQFALSFCWENYYKKLNTLILKIAR